MLLNTASSCLSNGKSRDLIFPVIFASPVNGKGLDLWDTHLTWIVNKVWEVLEEKKLFDVKLWILQTAYQTHETVAENWKTEKYTTWYL